MGPFIPEQCGLTGRWGVHTLIPNPALPHSFTLFLDFTSFHILFIVSNKISQLNKFVSLSEEGVFFALLRSALWLRLLTDHSLVIGCSLLALARGKIATSPHVVTLDSHYKKNRSKTTSN